MVIEPAEMGNQEQAERTLKPEIMGAHDEFNAYLMGIEKIKTY